MKDVIFLGPSLDLAQAREICPGDYRPPVRMGEAMGSLPARQS